MPRRKAPTAAPATGTKTPPSKAHKRQLSSSAVPTATATPGSRQSKRIKASTEHTPPGNSKNVTRKKSKYFDGPTSDEGEDEDKDDDDPAAAEEDEASGYEEDNASASHASSALPSASPSSIEEASDSSSDPRRKKNKNKKQPPQQANKRHNNAKNASTTVPSTTAAGSASEKGKELWRQGVKTGLGPGKEVFIERPKPRGDGGVKYVPERIHPNTMAFLADLKANNEREWLKSECGLGPFFPFLLVGVWVFLLLEL